MISRRMITSSIWKDEWFGQLDFFLQTLWIGLFSSSADDQGRLLDNAALIRADVFPYKDVPIKDIEAALVRFAEAARIIRYVAGGKPYVQILHWWEHQQPQWAQPSHFPAPPDWIDHIRATIKGKYITKNWPPPEYPGKAVQVDRPGGQSTPAPDVPRQYLDLDHDSLTTHVPARARENDEPLDPVEHMLTVQETRPGVASPAEDKAAWIQYGTDALNIFHAETGLYPNPAQRDDILALAGEAGFVLERWKSSCHTCAANLQNSRNVGCMIDTYRDGGDYREMMDKRRGKPNGRGIEGGNRSGRGTTTAGLHPAGKGVPDDDMQRLLTGTKGGATS